MWERSIRAGVANPRGGWRVVVEAALYGGKQVRARPGTGLTLASLTELPSAELPPTLGVGNTYEKVATSSIN
jgi:hypothetical protein